MRLFFALLLTFTSAFIANAHAQRSDSIAAVVNSDVITFTDVYDRIDMIIKSSGMPNKDEFRQKLLPQILTGLITESVQIQEAKRLGLQTAQEEIDTGFAAIAEQNKLKSDQFKKLLASQNVRIGTIERQILAQLAWGKVIQREIRPRVILSDNDINTEVTRLKSREGQTEYSLAEIILPFDEKGDDAKALSVAQDLSKQLSKDIQKFPAAARQFSQSSSAANGGIIGWVTLDQMTPKLAEIVETLEPRTISKPIKTDDGYALYFIREKRQINLGIAAESEQKLRIKMAKFSLTDNEAERKAQADAATIFARDVTGCLDIMKRTASSKDVKLEEIFDTQSVIPADILAAVENKSIGEAATPITRDSEIIVPMLCGREGGGGATTALEREIEERMGLQRMDILQKRYLRDLIADAYIERRI